MLLNMLNKFIFLLKKLISYQKKESDLRLIRESSLFNKAWYLVSYPDVAQAKADPALHYLRFGSSEGRDPGPNFSSSWYLKTYEDVKKSGINPLIHYLKYGIKEGRTPQNHLVEIDKPLFECSVFENKLATNASKDLSKQKVFCIGLNKTGTTSIESVLKDFGYKMGNQPEAELLMSDWAVRDFRRIVEYCRTADAFQDVPFSLHYTYSILDYEFPNSKFILTVRNNPDEWFDSLVRFYSKILGTRGIPTVNDLRNSPYRGLGWIWQQQMHIFGADESTLLDEKLYKSYYTNHNNQVLEYFKYRPKDLLVLNLAETTAMQSLCEFLGIKYNGEIMPRLNQSTSPNISQETKSFPEITATIPASLYDTVFARLAESATLKEIWRSVYAEEYPSEVGFGYNFLTLTELRQIVTSLSIGASDRFIDIGCGQGVVSLWVAQQTGASVIGVDYSKVAIQFAESAAKNRGLQDRTTFIHSDASATNIASASLDGAISIDSLQLMPDPLAVIVEVARILKPGAAFAFTAWAIHKPPFPGRAIIHDYRPLLEKAGFQVERYVEPENWRQQEEAVYSKIREHSDALKRELGQDASAILLEDAVRRPSQLPDFNRILVLARKHMAN